MKGSDFFKRSKGGVIFMGDIMTIDIPKRYENFGWLRLEDNIEIIGIFTMVINDNIEIGYNCHALITTSPSDIEKIVVDGEPYVRLVYKKNDMFLVSEEIIQQGSIPYNLLNEFVKLGKLPAWMNYKNSYRLFDNLSKLTGVKFSADRVYFHIMIAHCWRDPDNIMQMYRNSDMNKPAVFIPMGETSHSALTTMARTVGSSYNKGMVSAIVNPTEEVSDLEQLMRK